MIQVTNITKSFIEGTLVLDKVSSTFLPGKTNLIIGQSGSGKTVLMKSIIGLHEVDSGEIYYGDECFSEMNNKERKLIRQKVGMIFQGGALFDSMTVGQNVRFPLDIYTNLSIEEKEEIVHQTLKRVNLENSSKLFPSEISGGMIKRTSIARAIVNKPKYLFCDEPNSGLDPRTSIVIDNLIHEITMENNITTIINTHDMNSVFEIGDNIVFIHKGKKWWEGNGKNILESDNKELNEFVFASKIAKLAKEGLHR